MAGRYLFVGGPGRSGTSLLARCLGRHPGIATFKDIELKIFCEKNGLLDLHHSLVVTYTPNRATVAVQQFAQLSDALLHGRYGQAALSPLVDPDAWESLVGEFLDALSIRGHPQQMSHQRFAGLARLFVDGVRKLAVRTLRPEQGDAIFLEKTPHTLLGIRFLEEIAPGSSYLHVMRDPRAIAYSLRAMPWGPDALESCAEWVGSYCRAYLRTRKQATSLGLDLMEVLVEEVVANPDIWADALTGWLSIDPTTDLLAGSSSSVVNAGIGQASEDELALLDARLADCARDFGYALSTIGEPAGIGAAAG